MSVARGWEPVDEKESPGKVKKEEGGQSQRLLGAKEWVGEGECTYGEKGKKGEKNQKNAKQR